MSDDFGKSLGATMHQSIERLDELVCAIEKSANALDSLLSRPTRDTTTTMNPTKLRAAANALREQAIGTRSHDAPLVKAMIEALCWQRGIMGGSIPCWHLNGKILTTGDELPNFTGDFADAFWLAQRLCPKGVIKILRTAANAVEIIEKLPIELTAATLDHLAASLES